MSFQNTQLISLNKSDYDTSRVRFSKPIVTNLQNQGGPTISFKRIPIGTLNEDGTKGELVIATENIFSFGVQENTDPTTKKVNGYVMPLCLYNRDGASKAEENWVRVFNNIVDKCKDYLIENRAEIERYDLDLSELKKFNPLWYKKDKGKIVEGTGPQLYCKLIVSKKQKNKILTLFSLVSGDSITDDVNPLDLLGKFCYVNAAVKIESIFIGRTISLQIKLYEAHVRLLNNAPRPMLERPKVRREVIVAKAEDDNEENEESNPESEESNDDEGSLKGSSDSEEEEEPEPVPKPAPKKVVKRIVRRGVRNKT
jgi:hypothetical protein